MRQRKKIFVLIVTCTMFYALVQHVSCSWGSQNKSPKHARVWGSKMLFLCPIGRPTGVPLVIIQDDGDPYRRVEVIKEEGFRKITLGGMPRSGTTLMRVMLDAHFDVRCGEETYVIPQILAMRAKWYTTKKVLEQIISGGVTEGLINSAISSFIMQVMVGHGQLANRICNKDPFTMKAAKYLSELYPNSKFIMMIRDGRAVVHSIISRNISIGGFNLNDVRQCLVQWNNIIADMIYECDYVGARCLKVYYEQLVLHPEPQMRRVLSFLNLSWDPNVLMHEQFIGKEVLLSKTAYSFDQVLKPINVDALAKWFGKIPADVIREMNSVAPMLRILGYDPDDNFPNYGALSS